MWQLLAITFWIIYSDVRAVEAVQGSVVSVADLQSRPASILAVASRGNGFVGWLKSEKEATELFVQRISPSGTLLWGPDGQRVVTSSHPLQDIVLAPDAENGLIILWREENNGASSLRQMRLNSSGKTLKETATVSDAAIGAGNLAVDNKNRAITVWPEKDTGRNKTGIRLAVEGEKTIWIIQGSAQYDLPTVICDREGYFIVWHQADLSVNLLVAQNLTPTKKAVWGPEGAVVTAQSSHPYVRGVVFTPRLELAILWQDLTAGGSEWSAQLLDGGGMRLWGENGLSLAEELRDKANPAAALDKDGVVTAAWEDVRLDPVRILAQQWNFRGLPVWNVEGLTLTRRDYGEQRNPMVVGSAPDALLFWCDNAFQPWELFSQRPRSQGRSIEPSGIRVAALGSQFDNTRAISDGQGGAYIFWCDTTGAKPCSLQVTRVSPNGKLSW